MSCFALSLLVRILKIQPQKEDTIFEAKEVSRAIGTVLIEHAFVRLTRWYHQQPADRTRWHRRTHEYVGVPMFVVDLLISAASMTVTSSVTTGGS